MTETCSLDNKAVQLQYWRLRENFLLRRNCVSVLCYDKNKSGAVIFLNLNFPNPVTQLMIPFVLPFSTAALENNK